MILLLIPAAIAFFWFVGYLIDILWSIHPIFGLSAIALLLVTAFGGHGEEY